MGRLFCIQTRIDKMLGFICIALMSLSAFGYQWNQRYNHWHVGTWQIFPEECDPYCFPHVDRFAVKIWKPLGSTWPQEIDEEDVKNSIFELDPDLVCSGPGTLCRYCYMGETKEGKLKDECQYTPGDKCATRFDLLQGSCDCD